MDYKSAGVDRDLADKFVERIKRMVGSTHNENVVGGIGGFAALYRMSDDRLLAASTDGVGTKLKLAIDLGIHDTVGIDLVAMCVNDLICTGASPMFFLDYFATGKLELGVGEAVLAGIVEGCRQGQLALIGGETAEMPGMYGAGDYDLAGFAVGEVRKADLLDGAKVRPGQTLIGIASSGFHSNGYSLVRKLLELSPDQELSKAALAPTRIYVQLIQQLRSHLGEELTGLANITGSGLLNIPRMNEGLSYHVEHLPSRAELPAAMQGVLARSTLSERELQRTFNMGLGMVFATTAPETALSFLRSAGEKAWVIGKTGDAEAGEIFVQGEKL